MHIICGFKKIEIMTNADSIKVELVLNKSIYGKTYNFIGDALYNFTDINVSITQFNYILEIITKNLKKDNYKISI
jgi:hypothetical protein